MSCTVCKTLNCTNNPLLARLPDLTSEQPTISQNNGDAMTTLSGPTNDLLHKFPNLYEKVFTVSTAPTCIELYQSQCGSLPRTALDIGSGPGRELADLAEMGIDCVGVDFVPMMVEYAQKNYPKVEFIQGDMREFRLGRKFDMITILGACINYMLDNADLEKALTTVLAHSHEDTVVIVEPYNTTSFVGTNTPPLEYVIPDGEFKAVGSATYEWSQKEQLISRVRTWRFSEGQDDIQDTYKQRLYFAKELQYFFEKNGFSVVNTVEHQQSKIYNKSLFLLATPSN